MQLDHDLSVPSRLAAAYPNTVAAFGAMGALDHLERIAHMDQVWAAMRHAAPAAPPAAVHQVVDALPPVDAWYDLIYAGGGLGLLHAAVMAQRYDRRVLLFDRGEVGCAHREWNISREELAALVATGVCSWEELAAVVMNEYDRGVVRFHAAPGEPTTELWMQHVLDVALDAGALLRLARRTLEAAGGVVLDRQTFRCVLAGAGEPLRVAVELADPSGATRRYGGRLLLDGMGSVSPLALARFGGQPFAGVCPTVGTVVRGLECGSAHTQHDPCVGDILVSVADAQRGQQYMWEGFPGRDDELTVYLFYYDTIGGREMGDGRWEMERDISPTPDSQLLSPNLMRLFEDYFALLPTYKQPGAEFRHLKPVYGYIPARHSVRHQEAPLLRGVLPVGDSAAQQSPLTFCGFGSHVRNLGRTTTLLNRALTDGLTAPQHLRPISSYQVNVSLNWVFSRFMQPWRGAASVNQLQNIFLGVLNDLGEDLARRFFRDQMRWGDYHRMVLGMFRRHPRIVLDAWAVLGPRGVRQWIGDYVAYSGAAVFARMSRSLGPRGRARLVALAGSFAPAWRLRLLARFAEYAAMGWV